MYQKIFTLLRRRSFDKMYQVQYQSKLTQVAVQLRKKRSKGLVSCLNAQIQNKPISVVILLALCQRHKTPLFRSNSTYSRNKLHCQNKTTFHLFLVSDPWLLNRRNS